MSALLIAVVPMPLSHKGMHLGVPLAGQRGSTTFGLPGWRDGLGDGVLFGLIPQALAVCTHT